MNPIDFIDGLKMIVMVGVPIIAIASGIASLFFKETRVGIPLGLGFAIAAFFLTVATFGGKQVSGSFGGAIVFAMGFPVAGAGFLIGLGLVVIFKSRPIGTFFLAAGLVFPLMIVAARTIEPALIKKEQLLWQNLIVTGKVDRDVKYYQQHLSKPTRQTLSNRINRPEYGLIPQNVLELMDSFGFDVARHPNLSPELANRLYRSPKFSFYREEVAQNPSIPAELKLEIFKSNDMILMQRLAFNKSLDNSMKAMLSTNFIVFISECKSHKQAYGSDYYAAVSGLDWLQRLAKQTADMPVTTK